MLERAKKNKYDPGSFYFKNEFWIEKGRKTYEVKAVKEHGPKENLKQFMIAYGFDPQEDTNIANY